MSWNLDEKTNLDALIQNIYIQEIIFIVLIVLCIISDFLGEISDRTVILYWLLMAPIFLIGSLICEKANLHKTGQTVAHYVKFECLFWGSAFVSILLVLLLWHADLMTARATGLVIHIVLAHTMFLTGMLLGVRFYLLGLFLFFIAGLDVIFEAEVGDIFLMAVPVVIVGLYYEKHFLFPNLKKMHEDLSKDQE